VLTASRQTPAAGIGTALGLPTETIYQAVQQALHVTTTTRQSRKGEISSWKAYAPAFAGKMAIEAVDRVMRGEGAPSPAWEGEDGFVAWLLSGPKAEYHVPLPERGEAKRAILNTYTKEHSAEYQSQALIDLAQRMGRAIPDLSRIADRLQITGDDLVERCSFRTGDLDDAALRCRQRQVGDEGSNVFRRNGLEQAGRKPDFVSVRT